MSANINNNFYPLLEKHIDQRLNPVLTADLLLDPTVDNNFIYLGARTYVISENKEYRCELLNNVKTWVAQEITPNLVGVINVTPGTTILDLSLASPSIELCSYINIKVVQGTTCNISSITNFPEKRLTFFTDPGQTIIFIHTDYDVASNNQLVFENGFNFILTGRQNGNEYVTLMKHATAICQWDAVQFVKSNEWVQNLINLVVINDLTSQETDKALSAAMGAYLELKKQNKLIAGRKVSLEDLPATQSVPYPTTKVNVVPEVYTSVVYLPLTINNETTAMNVLASVNPSVSDEPRICDFRRRDTNGYDYGFWLLPAGKDGSVTNNSGVLINWICLQKPEKQGCSSIRGNAVVNADLSTYKVGDNVRVPFNVSSVQGDLLNFVKLDVSATGSNSFKQYFRLTEAGTYTVKAIIRGSIYNAAPPTRDGYFLGNLMQVTGIPTDSSTGTSLASAFGSAYVPEGDFGVIKAFQVIVEGTFSLTDPLSNNGFFIQLSEISNTWTDVVLNNSTLTITKHK